MPVAPTLASMTRGMLAEVSAHTTALVPLEEVPPPPDDPPEPFPEEELPPPPQAIRIPLVPRAPTPFKNKAAILIDIVHVDLLGRSMQWSY